MTDLPRSAQSEGVEDTAPAPAGSGARPLSRQDARARDARFREIYDLHFTYAWHSLRRFGVWERDLEDAAHDLFVIVHRRLDDYDETRPMKPWLLGIAFRVASDFRRKSQHRHEVVGVVVEPASTLPSADAQMQQKERRALVLRALDALDFDKRAVFVLHELEGYAMPAIAAMLEAPLNTCYSRLRAARTLFADAVRAQSGLPAATGGTQ